MGCFGTSWEEHNLEWVGWVRKLPAEVVSKLRPQRQLKITRLKEKGGRAFQTEAIACTKEVREGTMCSWMHCVTKAQGTRS